MSDQSDQGVGRIRTEGELDRWMGERDRRLTRRRGAPEEWRLVGATGEPDFENGWENLPSGSGGETPCAFRKDPHGHVHLKGMVTSGTADPVFTLPAGYRHNDGNAWQGYAQTDGGGQALVSVSSNGEVALNVDKSGGGWVILSGAVAPWPREDL